MHVDGLVPSPSLDQEDLAIRHQPMEMMKSVALRDKTLPYSLFYFIFLALFVGKMMDFLGRDGMRLGMVPCQGTLWRARGMSRGLFFVY